MPICIHMDPIATEDEATNRVRQQMNDFLREIDPALSMHDFRMVMGQDRINLIFRRGGAGGLYRPSRS